MAKTFWLGEYVRHRDTTAYGKGDVPSRISARSPPALPADAGVFTACPEVVRWPCSPFNILRTWAILSPLLPAFACAASFTAACSPWITDSVCASVENMIGVQQRMLSEK